MIAVHSDAIVASVRDENHAAPNTFYTYDPAGRLATVTQTLAGAPSGVITTSYAYDVLGNLVTVTDPNGNETAYVYDDFGRMTAQHNPVTGTTAYEYDDTGNLTHTTDANGDSTVRTYDAANRVQTAVSSRASDTETVTWTYDSAASGAFGLGRLATMDDPSGITAYSYDRRGLLRQESHTILGTTYLQTYRYDANGNRTLLGYPSGRTVTYAFDYAERPVSATGASAGQTTLYVTSATYLPFGPPTSLTLGNGTTETRTYDTRFLPLTSNLTTATATLAQYTYSRDAAGNITAIADGTNAGYSRTFGYDDLNRLTTANTGSALWGSGSYTYDRMGNMLASALGTPTRTFTHQGTTPRINTATGLASAMTYDAAGNELKSPAGDPSDGTPAAVYSPRNLLQSQFIREYDRCFDELGEACFQADPVQIWLYNVYDGRGVRATSTESVVANTININDPAPPTRVYFYTPELAMLNIASRTTGRTADVIWFGSRPIADHDGLTVRYTYTDHLGTPILQTSSTATVVWRAEYEPFGSMHALRAGTAADDQPLRFPGQQVAYATGIGEENYNIFRWYRGGWGRYTQADPRDIPTYNYAASEPVDSTDPLGLYAIKNMIKELQTTNIGVLCGSLGSACTLGVYALLACDCSCSAGGFAAKPTLQIGGKLYYYPGNPKMLKTKPVDPTVISPATSIQHEWSWHLNNAIAAVDSSIKELEQKSFQTEKECQQTCGSYREWVAYTFSSYLSYTQYVENKKQKPLPSY